MKITQWDKTTITEPGLYAGVPLDLYHERRFDPTTGEFAKARMLCKTYSLSSSALRLIFSESPADYWDRSPYNEKAAEPADKEAWVLGRALHHLVLGEANFAREYIARPRNYLGSAWNSNRTDCKVWLRQQSMDGKTVLKPDQIESLRGMSEEIGKHPLFRAGILNGLVEHSMVAVDKKTGIYLKSRPDAIPTDSGDYADLKITRSIHSPDLATAIAEYGYHQQAALTREVADLLGIKMTSYALFFVQHTRPYSCRVVQLKPHDMDRGHKQNRYAIDAFARCMKSGHWPGPGGERADAEYIELPEWAGKSIDGRLEYLDANQPKGKVT